MRGRHISKYSCASARTSLAMRLSTGFIGFPFGSQIRRLANHRVDWLQERCGIQQLGLIERGFDFCGKGETLFATKHRMNRPAGDFVVCFAVEFAAGGGFANAAPLLE